MKHTDERLLLATYLQDGYAKLSAFLDAPSMKELDQNLERFINTTVSKMPVEQVFYENKSFMNYLSTALFVDLQKPYLVANAFP